MQDSTSPRQRGPMTLQRKTTMGVPVRIEIDEWTISAYREEPAQVLKSEYRVDGSVHVEVEPELSRHLTSEPVMTIRKNWSPGDFTVDFEAGFQRGPITVGQRGPTRRGHWPNPGAGDLKRIGRARGDPGGRDCVRHDSTM